MDFIVYDLVTLTIGKPADILVWNPSYNLFYNLFSFTSYDQVDIGTPPEKALYFHGSLVSSDDYGDFLRQLRDKITNVLKLNCPLNANAYQIDFGSDKPVEHTNILVCPLIPKVEKCNLVDQALHARSDVLQARWGENPHNCGRIREIRIQSENMLILYHLKIIRENIRKCKRKNSLIPNNRKVDFH
jgi:hypothetical protein